jgi:hypothetical protein
MVLLDMLIESLGEKHFLEEGCTDWQKSESVRQNLSTTNFSFVKDICIEVIPKVHCQTK